MTTTTALAAWERVTPKQISFLNTLMQERVHQYDVRDVARGIHAGTTTKKQVSEMITLLLGSPRRAKAAAPGAAKAAAPTNPATVPGIYRYDGEVYQVVRSKQSGRLYANLVNFEKRSRTYAPVINRLSATDRLTVGQVAALNLPFGWCCLCGRDLTDPVSVKKGIGPICLKKYAA